jgi:hypothetical protein
MGMGYQGFAKIDGTLVLVTGSSVNIVIEPIVSAAAVGLGWYNAATATHYANAALRYEGGIDFDFQESAAVWDSIGEWALYNRLYAKKVLMSPDGQKLFAYGTGVAGTGTPAVSGDPRTDSGGAWCSQFNVSAGQGSPVRVSATMLAIKRVTSDVSATTGFWNQKFGYNGETCSTFSGFNPLNPASGNQDPIPFWKTNARLIETGSYTPLSTGSTMVTEFGSNVYTVEWNIGVNNNTTALYTCGGTSTTEGGSTFGLPQAILVGPMDVTGSVTLFDHDGVPNIIGRPANTTGFQVIIGANRVIELPAVMISGDNYGIQGIEAPVNRTYELRAFGGKCGVGITEVLPPCIITNSAGDVGEPLA